MSTFLQRWLTDGEFRKAVGRVIELGLDLRSHTQIIWVCGHGMAGQRGIPVCVPQAISDGPPDEMEQFVMGAIDAVVSTAATCHHCGRVECLEYALRDYMKEHGYTLEGRPLAVIY